MKKYPLIFIGHILESIEKIESYARKLTKEKLTGDTKIQDAIIRRIEVIGEAVKNLSADFRDKYPNVEWGEIIRTRDKIIHHYFGVDLNVVWSIINKDIPDLKKKIQKILEESENKSQKL